MSDEQNKPTGAAKFIRWILVVLVLAIVSPSLIEKISRKAAEHDREKLAAQRIANTPPILTLRCQPENSEDLYETLFLKNAFSAGWKYAYVTVPASCSTTEWLVRPDNVHFTFHGTPAEMLFSQIDFENGKKTGWLETSPIKIPAYYDYIRAFRWKNPSSSPIVVKIAMD